MLICLDGHEKGGQHGLFEKDLPCHRLSDFAPYRLNEGIALARRCKSELFGLHVIDQGMITATVNISEVSWPLW